MAEKRRNRMGGSDRMEDGPGGKCMFIPRPRTNFHDSEKTNMRCDTRSRTKLEIFDPRARRTDANQEYISAFQK